RREASTWRSDLEEFRRASPQMVELLRVDGETADRSRLAYPAPPPGTTPFLPSAALPAISPRDELIDDFYEVLALGVADYYRKIGAFKGIGLALSGGRDSLRTLLGAWRAVQLLHPDLGGQALRDRMKTALHAFFMPSRYSSDATHRAAVQIAEDL
uniref:hypothetical protein n=1 Tax=Aeromonas sp. EERV15 TaxID=1833892 RepID=UPI000A76DF9B